MAEHCDAPMRILMIAPQPFYEDRGTPIVLRRVLQASSQCGHQVDLITFPGGETVSIDGLRIFRVGTFLGIRNIPIGLSVKKLILDIFLLPAMIRMLRRQHYDCIHAVEEAAFPALISARLFKVPLLYDMQSCLPEQMRARRFFSLTPVYSILSQLERFLVRRVDFVACSVGLKEHINRIAPDKPVREWHFPTTDLDYSSSSTDQMEFNLDIPADSYVILYAGNFAPYQGVDQLVKAIPQVLEDIPNAVFVFVGAKGDESLPGLHSGHTPGSAVRVVSRQPQEHMARFLRVANVVVSPRVPIANLPLKVLDYMASRKPIVATDSKSHRKVLHDDSALLVDHNSVAFASAIVRLYKDPALAERLAVNAHQFALEELGWDVFVDEIEKIYSTVRNMARTA
jgi:glycosyltransferase involved in cell wall biosynthesis